MSMREALLGFFLVFIAFFSEIASATVVFKPFSISLPDLPAKFAVGNNTSVCGALEVAVPLDACTTLRNEFGSNKSDTVRFALIIRGNCSFEEKIRNAQNGGFSAAIVFDDKYSSNLVYMMVNPKGINVLAVFISKSSGEFLKDRARGEKGECCIYPPLNGKAWTVFAICFLSLVVIAAFLVIAFIAPRSLSNWRRRNLVKCVDTKTVEALPCVVFSSDHASTYAETCAICLEDYNDGELLKVLPCQHDFHSSCVESWLTKWGTFCPVCKLDMTTKFAYSESAFCACKCHPHQKFVSAPVYSHHAQIVWDDADVAF
ncbi:receptor homology region, transmembrane domain- and RING domain-containing protein 1-like isoform X2 [Hibiscus syriacus]|uniref:receptor homology region, transmembrane domain- and RING domain-containing protein 1-like isoform X2 n=1 Tax=Hibiscus syriacus TaxID=106335 RepID=UPI001922D83F|nr:receptor homology region, transmembrane domain- and RING domain-containing protein 1-like isoform X2 [Hibiscus syriacus]